ncbi:MAG: sigma 54-interacting transcriptional regulator, partial [Polyangiaceae bacterium]|nr:sigma 54-interacting transcriptional regulator [Polyangiaceae bacterium]
MNGARIRCSRARWWDSPRSATASWATTSDSSRTGRAGSPRTARSRELPRGQLLRRVSIANASARKLGRVEIANHGTLFLDEIGDVSAAIQVKLLWERLLCDGGIRRAMGYLMRLKRVVGMG